MTHYLSGLPLHHGTLVGKVMQGGPATATSETAPYGRSAKSQAAAYSRVLACAG